MSFWHWIFRRKQEELELDEELRFHLEQEAQLRVERGEAPDRASTAARRDFGNVARTREEAREMWGWGAVERAAQDLRFAARMFRKNPAFTALAIAALALGIGATTVMFSVVNSVLLRPLPYADPGRLVMVWERPPSGKLTNVVQTQNFLDWRARNRSFTNIAALISLAANFEGEGEPVQIPSLRVTAGFFEIMGVAPMLGRTITPEDDITGVPPVAVLSEGFWQRRFGGREDVIGKSVRIDGQPCKVIGVMPPGFSFPAMRADLYTPVRISLDQAARDGRNYSTIARLRPGISLTEAEADMRAIAAQTARERPQMNAKWSTTIVPLMEQTVGDTRTTLLVLLAAVGFVLLIACANVANLLLMRASARRREMTVRVALGAGRWRLLHQLMMESLLLALAAGLLGFSLAYWGVPAIVGMLPAGFPLPRVREISVDRTVLGFSLLVSLGCGIFFGIFPALQVDRGRLSQSLYQGGRSNTSGNRLLRNLLVVSEVAVAMLLVIGSGLMLRSFILLRDVDPGFRPERLLTIQMRMPVSKWGAQSAAEVQQMLERIRALSGIAGAASIHLLPMTGMQSGSGYSRVDRPEPEPGTLTGGDISVVSDGYFRTMGIAMTAGREFDERDRAGSVPTAILNQTAAKMLYPDENPLGKRLRVAWNGPREAEIIGVASDIRHNGLETRPDPCLFLPNAQRPNLRASLVIRTSAAPSSVIAAVKEQMRAVDPSQGVADIETMEELISDSIARPKLETAVLVTFGVLALALACLGIYAVISYSVEQRNRELGIRLALGAAPLVILVQVLKEGLGLGLAGIATGLLASAALTRYLESLLYTVRPTDPLVFAAVSGVLAAAAMAGCYFPARRATRVDPALVLREE
jgi:putative ABC transport system permease protein